MYVLLNLHPKMKNKFKNYFVEKNFLTVDKVEVAKQKYINVLVGSLNAPNQTFLVDCHTLDSSSNVNSSIILDTVDDILRQLEIKRENFSLFLTDATRHMSLAGKTLKNLYPSMMHLECVAHLLYNCALPAHFQKYPSSNSNDQGSNNQKQRF